MFTWREAPDAVLGQGGPLGMLFAPVVEGRHVPVCQERPIADELTEEPALDERPVTTPCRRGPVVMKEDLVTGSEIGDLFPLALQHVTSVLGDGLQLVIRCQSQLEPVLGDDLVDVFGAGREEAV